MESHRVTSIISGRSPPLNCTLTLITMLGDQNVSGTRFSMLDWVRVTGLSCTKGVWYIYDRDTGQLIRCVEGLYGLPLSSRCKLLRVNTLR